MVKTEMVGILVEPTPQFAPISGGHLALEPHSHPSEGRSNSNFSLIGLFS